MMKILKAFSNILTTVEDACSTVGLLLCTGMVVLQILNRYTFQLEIIWINDLAVFIFVFYILFALIVTTRENGHIALDILADKICKGDAIKKHYYDLVIRLIALGVVVVTLFPCWRFAARALKYPQYATLVRWFNTSWMMEALCVAMFAVALRMILLIIENAAELRSLLIRSAAQSNGRNV